MPFNIQEFSSQVNKHGVSTNNLFVSSITLPDTMQSLMQNPQEVTTDTEKSQSTSVQDYSQMLTFLCRTVQIPDLNIDVANIQPEGYGNPHRRPTNMQFGQLQMVFMVDAQYRTLAYFQRWLQSIINYDTSIPRGEVDLRKKFFMAYKKDYQATIDVTMYSYASEQFTYNHKFAGCYPTSVGGIQLAWENQAEIMLLPVTFTYDTMITSGMKQGTPNSTGDGGISFLSRLSQLNTIGQAISSIRRPRSILGAIREVDRLNTIFDNL